MFTLFSIGFLAFLLLSNYTKDKGLYTKQKVMHALALGYVVLLGAGSFAAVVSQVQHFAAFKAHYSVAIGFVPAPLNFISALLGSILDLILFLAAFKAAQRNAMAVMVFRYTLLISIPTGIINFYRGLLVATTDASGHTGLLIAAGIITGIKLGLFLLYGTSSMREFLTSPAGITRSDNSWKEQA